MGDIEHDVQLLRDMGLSSGDRLSEIIALRSRITELESALAKSASREAALVEKVKLAEEALNNSDTGVCAFKEWYDAIWLGDQEHGQTLPKSGPEYDRYMDGYTLAYGAWNAALAKIKEAS